jgi:Flp pilus assembly protein TadD
VTRACDVPRLQNEPIIQRLEKLIPVEFVEFDPSAYKTTHLALSGAHRIALARAAAASAHFVLLDPDLIFSSNTLASARRVASTGKSAIMVSGLRLTTETAMPTLRALRLWETYGSAELLQPRNLMKFAMENFHPEVARYYFDSPNFTQWPLVNLWRVGNEGLLDRSFHLHPLVFDMRRYKPEAMSVFDYDTIDGAFAFHAFPDRDSVYVETDSDNMLVFSFSSAKECIEPMKENRASIELLRQTAHMFNVNALHRSFFDHAIKLHTGDLNEKWAAVERSTASLSKHFRSPPQSLGNRISAGMARLTRRPSTAMIATSDDRWHTFRDRGIQRDAEGDYFGAAADFAEAIRIGPPNGALHLLRGIALAHAGDRQRATEEFELCLKIDPTNGTLRSLVERYRSARDDRWKAFQHRGVQRDAEGDHVGAAAEFAEAIRIGPANASLHFLRGLALVHAGDHHGATSEFELGLELDPTNASLRILMDTYRWRALQDRGIQRDAKGDHFGAAADFAEAIRIGPPNPALHFLRGMALLQAGDHKGATSEFKLGLKLDPANTTLQSLLQAYRPEQTRRLARRIKNKLNLIKFIVVDSLAHRQSIKSRLLDCLKSSEPSAPTSRARIRWRIRQACTLLFFDRRLPEFPDSP